MTTAINILVLVLSANAAVSFFVFFFFQGMVILKVFGESDHKNAMVPWKALGDPKSPQVNMGRFIAGEIFPELRRKWSKALLYVVASFLALLIIVGLLQAIAPEILW